MPVEQITPNDVIVVDPSPVHIRPYDHDLGDERRFDRQDAITRARVRVSERGCRQQVRKVAVAASSVDVVPSWLIQDI
jgi:hypothetical protein